MDLTTILLLLAALAVGAFFLGRGRALILGGGVGAARNLHSLPDYYGYFAVLCATLPPLFVLGLWVTVEEQAVTALVVADLPAEVRSLSPGQLDLFLNSMRNAAATAADPVDAVLADATRHYLSLRESSRWLVTLLSLSLGLAGMAAARRFIHPAFRARNRVESAIGWLLMAASSVAVLTTFGIVFSVLSEALRFFGDVPLHEFLFGTSWSPQTAIRDDQVGSAGRFGILPLLTGTLLIALTAMVVAIPVGVFAAVYTAEYASARVRGVARPVLEMLAGIPTVVYGFFTITLVAPWIREIGTLTGLDVATESALAAGLVMGFMIVPLVSSLSDDAIRAVPTSIREGAVALGATRSEVVLGIVLPAATPGIAGGILLAVSRAIGETMIVVMAAGLAANLSFNPLESVTTVTVQIATLLVGDQEFDSTRTLAAFALGLVLFTITMLLNLLGLNFVRRYRERYE